MLLKAEPMAVTVSVSVSAPGEEPKEEQEEIRCVRSDDLECKDAREGVSYGVNQREIEENTRKSHGRSPL